MNINIFPRLKRRNIIVWRIARLSVLTFFEIPTRVMLYVLAWPLEMVYSVGFMIYECVRKSYEICRRIFDLVMRYCRACKRIIRETAEEERTMEANNTKDSVCSDCATRMGYEQDCKGIGVWLGRCDFCGEHNWLTSLSNDWHKK